MHALRIVTFLLVSIGCASSNDLASSTTDGTSTAHHLGGRAGTPTGQSGKASITTSGSGGSAPGTVTLGNGGLPSAGGIGNSGGNVPEPTGGTFAISMPATGGSISSIGPLKVVFVYDSSSSMGDDPADPPQWHNLASRWEPMKLGMLAWFNSNPSADISASITFFPASASPIPSPYVDGKDLACHWPYENPDVEITPLSSPQSLISAVNGRRIAGGTPTLPALVGGISYAKKLMTDDPGSKAVVVLVTDGEPAIYNATLGQIETDCAPLGSTLTNTIPDIANVVNAAFRGTPSIPTYVIGVGSPESMDKMAAIATSGGTDFILLDPSKPPSDTSNRFTEALQSIER
jgi:hypothetical protein